VTVTKTELSHFAERYEIAGSPALIRAARYPLGPSGRQALLANIEAECGQIEQSSRRRDYAALREGESHASLCAERLEAARAASSRAEAAAASAAGSLLKTVIWAACSVACFAAEFVLTWHALCFVLNVPRYSLLGVLLGLAPPSGLAVIEVFLSRLFEEPWRALGPASSRTRRWAVKGAMALLLAAVAAGNALTVLHLAKAREESSRAERVLNVDGAETAAPIDNGAIDRAVLWVSLLVTVDGAIFLLLALREGASALSARGFRRKAAAFAVDRGRREEETAMACAQVECRRRQWECAEESARLDAARYRAFCLHLLEQAEVAAVLEKKVDTLVDESLRLAVVA
jgi:hypothetical protein